MYAAVVAEHWEQSVVMFLLAVVESNTVRSSLQNAREIFTKIEKFWLSVSSYEFVDGKIISYSLAFQHVTMKSALSSFLQCRKPCVIVDMDSVAPYLVDTIKISVFCKMEYIYAPPV